MLGRLKPPSDETSTSPGAKPRGFESGLDESRSVQTAAATSAEGGESASGEEEERPLECYHITSAPPLFNRSYTINEATYSGPLPRRVRYPDRGGDPGSQTNSWVREQRATGFPWGGNALISLSCVDGTIHRFDTLTLNP